MMHFRAPMQDAVGGAQLVISGALTARGGRVLDVINIILVSFDLMSKSDKKL